MFVSSNHICDALGREENNGHAMPVETGQDILVGFLGDRTDVRLEVGGVAHYCGKEVESVQRMQFSDPRSQFGLINLLPVHTLST